MADKISRKLSDFIYTARGIAQDTPADGTWSCIRVPKRAFVCGVWLNITTLCAGTLPKLSVGWLGNGETAVTDGFITQEVAACTFTGLKVAMHSNENSWSGKYFYDAAGTITVTVSGTLTAGIFYPIVQYSIIS